VLVIDDDGETARSIRQEMKAHGVQVLRALTGMHGYWTALRESPDVIVLNLHKPDRWVTALVDKLRAHSLTRRAPLLVFNPLENPDLESAMAGLENCIYLRQPFDLKTFKKELGKHVAFAAESAARTQPV
jgi:DNA-binding response OmpR family regulator